MRGRQVDRVTMAPAGDRRLRAGAEFFCHPKTVRYRMRRIEAGTGRVLANPGDVAELVTAVRAWRELPHS
jgi:DNA-binding PucR family transcriptional regulator